MKHTRRRTAAFAVSTVIATSTLLGLTVAPANADTAKPATPSSSSSAPSSFQGALAAAEAPGTSDSPTKVTPQVAPAVAVAAPAVARVGAPAAAKVWAKRAAVTGGAAAVASAGAEAGKDVYNGAKSAGKKVIGIWD